MGVMRDGAVVKILFFPLINIRKEVCKSRSLKTHPENHVVSNKRALVDDTGWKP